MILFTDPVVILPIFFFRIAGEQPSIMDILKLARIKYYPKFPCGNGELRIEQDLILCGYLLQKPFYDAFFRMEGRLVPVFR